MNVVIEYETALARHPAAVAEVMKAIARSRSKDRDCDPTHFQWTYLWCLSVQSFSMSDLLAGNLPTETRPLEARICGLSLSAEKGRKYARSETVYDYTRDGAEALPPEVRAYHEKRNAAAGSHAPMVEALIGMFSR